jgi:outer membrane receptor protein involved in Fe transport
VREDDVWVTSISPYADNKTRWNDWLRTNIGVRFDGFRFDVTNSDIADNNGERYEGLVSPKAGIIFGPWAEPSFISTADLAFTAMMRAV